MKLDLQVTRFLVSADVTMQVCLLFSTLSRFACCSPLSDTHLHQVVEIVNVHFTQLVAMLRGATVLLPDRHKVSKTLPQDLCIGLQGEFHDDLLGKFVTLSIDGWSDAKADATLGLPSLWLQSPSASSWK